MAVAFFSTWTTYGTWLPGDFRGWRERGRGERVATQRLESESRFLMGESAILLDPAQRRLVEQTIADHCKHRGWTLHAANCRSNHIHAIVTAAGRDIGVPREQFMAWCTRKLKERESALRPGVRPRVSWWTERGWDEYIDDNDDLANAMAYVLEEQDRPERFG